MMSGNQAEPFSQLVNQFHRISIEEKLEFLEAVQIRIGTSVTEKASGAVWSEIAHRLNQWANQIEKAEREQAAKDILEGEDTRFSRAYGNLDTNTQLAFWHKFLDKIRWQRPRATSNSPTSSVQDLIIKTESMTDSDQLSFLSQLVASLGA